MNDIAHKTPDESRPSRAEPLQVAVAVITDPEGRILISLRDDTLHQGGLWEFPGGKIEPGETPVQALAREIDEELGLTVTSATPLITIDHRYPDRTVRLLVYKVDGFSGTPKSCEGQPFRWVTSEDLPRYAFPAANRPIVVAARLPPYYAILDDADVRLLMPNLQKILNRGIKLIQARLKRLPAEAVKTFLNQAIPLCRGEGALLLVNSEVKMDDGRTLNDLLSCNLQIVNMRMDGIHLTSRHLLAATGRPGSIRWLSASCHNLADLRHAQRIGVDFAILAPVLSTGTHPDAKPMGWQKFSELVARINLPVYALGGMTEDCLPLARQAGGQGIAAIRAFL